MPQRRRTSACVRPILVAAILLLTAAHAARAAVDCSDQKGKVIIDDDFSDDTGGWPTKTDPGVTMSYGKPALTVDVTAPAAYLEFLNITFNPKDADYCLQLIAPKTLPDGVAPLAGLRLLDSPDSAYNIGVSSAGVINFSKYINNAWQVIASQTDATIKPGDPVTLRALLHEGLITIWGNGHEIKRVRIPVPDSSAKFGFYVSSTAVPPPGVEFKLTRLRVTTGQ